MEHKHSSSTIHRHTRSKFKHPLSCYSVKAIACLLLLLLCRIELLDPLTAPGGAQMAEWNKFYHNEDDEEEQEEGEQSGGEIKASS